MKNAEYWRRRFEILEEAQNKRSASLVADIERQFSQAQRAIDDQIRVWYGRFAENNQISLVDAHKWLTGKDLAEFKWDVNEYIKRGSSLDPAFKKQLENASAKVHITRLEALKLQTQNTMERLYGNQLDTGKSLFKRQYLDSYYHSAYNIQRGNGIGWDIAGINERQLEKVLSRPWTVDGETFSDRIWSQKNRLVNEVHTQLTQNMILGRSPDEAIKAIAAKFNTSRSNAGRLVMTESAYFTSLGEKDAYKELDVEEFEVLGTLDGKTCELCGDMDGTVGRVSNFAVGVNAPPYHPFCRCALIPHFDDLGGERFARGEEAYTVPADMKFNDWKKMFVDGGLKSNKNSGTISMGLPKTSTGSPKISMGSLEKKLGKVHTTQMSKIVENAPSEMREVWNRYADRLTVEDAHYKGGAHCSLRGVSMDIDKVAKGEKYFATGELAKKPYYTAFHEFGHNISNHMVQELKGYSWLDIADYYKSTVFKHSGGTGFTLTEMLHKEGDAYIKKIWDGLKAKAKANGLKASSVRKYEAHQKLLKEIKTLPISAATDVSDIWGGLTKNAVRAHYGHTTAYWKKVSVGTEAFAEMFSASIMNPESVAQIKHYFPNSYKIFEEIIKNVGVI